MTKTPNQPATRTAIDRVREQVKARRPWQLLMVGMGGENKAAVSPATTNALTRLFEYLPGLRGVTLQTADGDLHVSRVPRDDQRGIRATIRMGLCGWWA